MAITPKENKLIVAVRCLIQKNDSFLLVREKYEGTLETPGGTLKTGEDPEEGAKREAKEETGFEVEIVCPLKTITGKDQRGDILAIIFLARPVKQVSAPLSDIEEVKWMSCKDIKNMLEGKKVDWHDKVIFEMIVSGLI